MNGFDISTISGIYVGSTPYSAIYKGSTLVWSAGPPDYSTMPLTIESLEDNNTITIRSNGFSDTINMIINVPQFGDMLFWINKNTTNNIFTLNRGEKIQIKSGWPPTCTNSNYLTIGSSRTFNVYGNIMSVSDDLSGYYSYNTTLPSTYQFYRLFYNSKIVDASNFVLPATTLANYCYSRMFNGCTSLVKAPELPATTLAQGCYTSMFSGCTSLTSIPELPATTLAQGCYNSMFFNCTSLITIPSNLLSATMLADSCYYGMFYGCTSLTTAPELPATTLANNCYSYMFYGCTSLNYIKALFTTTPSTTYTDNWVYNVAASGTFIKSDSATWTTTGTSAAPATWGIYKEKEEPLTIVSLSDNNTISIENILGSSFTLTYDIYSKTISSSGTTTIKTINKNVFLRIKADTSSYTRSSSKYLKFIATGDFKVRGNIMSLLYSTNINTRTSVGSYQFYNLFKDNTYLKDASGLILPATSVGSSAYESMFSGCTSLVTPPRKLPAATFPSYTMYQYGSMFRGCTSLTTVPKLLNTTLTTQCYGSMFQGCTSLTTVPKDLLPATTLVAHCYVYMFYGCTSLTTAPDLPATTLVNNCYGGMFFGCTSLNYIKAMFTTDISSSTSYTDGWLYNVASSGTFIKNTSATWSRTDASGVPSGWTIQTASS